MAALGCLLEDVDARAAAAAEDEEGGHDEFLSDVAHR